MFEFIIGVAVGIIIGSFSAFSWVAICTRDDRDDL